MTGTMQAVESVLVEHFGQQPARASVSFVGVDPIQVLRFEPAPSERAYLTLGMSRRPMTSAAASAVEQDGPRAELMMLLRDPIDEFADVWRQLAVLGAAPSVEGVVYAPGMTIDLGQPLVPDSRCVGVVVDRSPLAEIVTDAGAVSILQVVPATSSELAWGRVRGGEALRERWTQDGTDLLDLRRRPVALQ